MKISCQSCQSKYTIADDKVAGKVVKIRCKKCGATIVVNGNDASAGAAATTSYPPDAPGADAGADAWTVNVADGDQRTMTESEIVDRVPRRRRHRRDVLLEGRDGRLAAHPRDRAALRGLQRDARRGSRPRLEDARAGSSGAGRPLARRHEWLARRACGGRRAGSRRRRPRRARGRAGSAADLFGGVAQAGGEEDVMTSAPVGMPQALRAARRAR